MGYRPNTHWSRRFTELTFSQPRKFKPNFISGPESNFRPNLSRAIYFQPPGSHFNAQNRPNQPNSPWRRVRTAAGGFHDFHDFHDFHGFHRFHKTHVRTHTHITYDII
jgi:hypothetical protein